MHTRYLIIFAFILFCFSALSSQQIITIVDSDLGQDEYEWTNNNEYHLDGIVVLEPGGVLSIQAGTIIKALPRNQITSGDDLSALIIARGAQIYAEGTAQQPIIFTTTQDDLSTPLDLANTDNALWGGVFILGKATVAVPVGESVIEGFPSTDPRFRFGGNVDNDNSGVFRFVSIRHFGAESAPDDESNGLTLAGVGSGTVIEYVEAYAGADDGFEFLGGSVNTRYLISTNCEDDAFDIDLGYTGVGQFWLGVQKIGEELPRTGRLLEIEGADPDAQTPFSQPNLANLTLIGGVANLIGDDQAGIFFRDNAAGHIRNSLVVNVPIPPAISIEDRDDTADFDSWARFQDEDLVLNNNVFNYEEGLITDWNEVASVLDPDEEIVTVTNEVFQLAIALDNSISNEQLIVSSCHQELGCFNPLPLSDSPISVDGIPITEPGFLPVSFQGAFGSGLSWLAGWSFIGRNQSINAEISGRIEWDEDVFDCGEPINPLQINGIAIQAQSESEVFNTVSNDQGFYYMMVPPGDFEVSALPENGLFESCNGPVVVNVEQEETIEINYSLNALIDCPKPIVDISSPFLRRCFDSQIYVDYANEGTVGLTETTVEVVLDEFIIYQSSNLPLSSQSGDTLSFEIGELAPFERGRIQISVLVSCDSEFGQEHCNQAAILSNVACPAPPLPRYEASAECIGDSVVFTIANIGGVVPSQPVPYIVIEDEVMLREGETQLPPGESFVFSELASESSFLLSTLAWPDSSEQAVSNAASTCASPNSFPLNSYSLETGFLEKAIDCQNNIGSFDPNDKYGSPVGIGPQNIVSRNPTIDYRIRFQNTGTDTAFNVVIIDTLSELLDPTTFRMGVASHDMEYVLDNRLLTVRFPDIMLPDSNVNEPESNGFFKFQISAISDLPLGTTFFNEADIYFDFNEPIRTNQTRHLIDEFFDLTSIGGFPSGWSNAIITPYPQPANNRIWFQVEGIELSAGWIMIYDSNGRRISKSSWRKRDNGVALNGLVSGSYTWVLFDRSFALVGSGQLVIN